MGKSIFLQRIIILLAVALLLAGALSATLYTVIMQNTYIRFQGEELLSVADAMANLIGQALQSEAPLSLHELLRNSERDFMDARLFLFDSDGKSILTPPPSARSMESIAPASPPEIADSEMELLIEVVLQRVLEGEKLTRLDTSHFWGDGFLISGVPVLGSDQTIVGAVIFAKSLAGFAQSFKGLQIAMLLGTLLTFLIMLLPGYFAAQRLTVPLLEMRDIALCMARGDFSRRVDESQKGEIGELASSLNRFAVESERLEKTRRDYVANVSHELRTPIAAIRSMSETLHDGLIQNEEKKQRYYRLLLDESLRLTRLINDLLELSRLQADGSAMRRSVFDLCEIITHALEIFHDTAEEAGICLEFDIATTSAVTVYSNPDRLEQVLVVLLDNALRCTTRGGSVAISIAVYPEQVEVSVRDSGKGIAVNDLPHIFERFYKADKAHSFDVAELTRTSSGGAGLGLSIAREIMTRLGEEIWVASTVGKGSCFTFTVGRKQS